MTTPTVTIGLPVHNGENFIRQAIESVLNQSYQDFELIISDNASTDQTGRLCVELSSKDPRIRYMRCTTNIGAGPNFNGLVSQAKGRYFKWIAHDDVIAPTFLEKCIDVLEADPTVALACPRVQFIDDSGKYLERYGSPFRTDDINPAVRFTEMLQGHRCFEVFGVIRRDLLLKTRLIGNYNHGDGVLLAHLALLGRFAQIPEHLFYSRRHQKQSMYVFGITNPNGIRDFEAYAHWFDPKNRMGISRSFTRMLTEYFRMTWVVSLSFGDRFACDRSLCRRFLSCWRIVAGEWKRTILEACGLSRKAIQQ